MGASNIAGPRARFGWALALAGMAACAYPRLDEPPPVSTAWDRPQETLLGSRVEELYGDREGDSGVYVLSSGLEAFAARMVLIETAEASVDAQYYVFHDDVTGRFVLSRMVAAADRGVRVRLLLDDMGTTGMDSLLAAVDVHPNIEVRLFNPLARGPIPWLARAMDVFVRIHWVNRRMHNKMLTADGAGAIVGGRNIGDEYFDAHADYNFADLDLFAVGAVLPELGAGFDEYWNSPHAVPLSAWKRLRASDEDLGRARFDLGEHTFDHRDSEYATRVDGSSLVRWLRAGELPLTWAATHALADDPAKISARGDDVAKTLLATRLAPWFRDPEFDLVVVSPYFIPGEVGLGYFRALTERGVRVRILTNSLEANDVALVHTGYRRYRERLLEMGVELYELRRHSDMVDRGYRSGAFGSKSAGLHSKTFCADEQTLFVGSLNLDPRSIALNTELGLVVDSAELAATVIASFDHAVQPDASWRVLLEREGSRTRLAWEGTRNGELIHLHNEPGTGAWVDLKLWLLSLLPIEGQL